MSAKPVSRRGALQLMSASAAIAIAPKIDIAPTKPKERPAFTYCLNMATIRGHKLGFVKELQTAAAAGFRSVEIWIDSWQEYLANGGTVATTKKLLDDLGVTVEDCISFNEWLVDDNTRRGAGIEQLKKEMDMLAQIGCKRVAATGKGTTATDVPALDVIAGRYRDILQIGDDLGVVPQLEMWGFQKNMSNVAEVLYAAMQSGHPKARILLDIFHLYRGNTSLETLPLMSPLAVDILHMNDYPASFNYQQITDADRIYPGDGVAPLKRILNILHKTDKPLVLSVELFNASYYAQDALTVAKTSLAKLKAVADTL